MNFLMHILRFPFAPAREAKAVLQHPLQSFLVVYLLLFLLGIWRLYLDPQVQSKSLGVVLSFAGLILPVFLLWNLQRVYQNHQIHVALLDLFKIWTAPILVMTVLSLGFEGLQLWFPNLSDDFYTFGMLAWNGLILTHAVTVLTQQEFGKVLKGTLWGAAFCFLVLLGVVLIGLVGMALFRPA